MTDISPEDVAAQDLAKAQFKRLTVVRWMGVFVAIVGSAIAGDKVALPHWLGVILLMVGVFYAMIFPRILVRRWKKAEQ